MTVYENSCMTECSSIPACNGVNYNSRLSRCDLFKCTKPREPTFSFVPDVTYHYVPPTNSYHSSYGR